MDIFIDDVSAPTASVLRSFIDAINSHISPKFDSMNEILEKRKNQNVPEDIDDKSFELFSLCKDQILKCCCLMVDIFKREISNSCIMEDSRNWVLNRISWCLDRLNQLEENISEKSVNEEKNSNLGIQKDKLSNSLIDLNLFVNDEFISWVDDSLELLEVIEKLFQDKTKFIPEFKNTSKYNQWLQECSSGLISLHKIIRELILSAMNICHNSLSQDQHIINARCHVVLRESKNFLSEIILDSKLITIDCDKIGSSNIKIKDSLHYPTIRLFITILKNAIHTLEACINRAVLGLVLKCLSDPLKPLNKITHMTDKDMSSEKENSFQISVDEMNKPAILQDFDVHSERLSQIGLFAISCSSDKQRVLQLKSCLASLEILDAHLVPTVISNPSNLHTQFLVDHWNNEIDVLRRCVFLIVDPMAFIDLVAEISLEKLNVMRYESPLKWLSTQALIDLGKCVLDYFNSYFNFEPLIFEKYKNLNIIVDNLKKVVKECQVVGDLFLMNPHEINVKNKVIELEKPTKDKKYHEQRVMKRLKLLHSLILKIVKELSDDVHTFDDEDDKMENNSVFLQETYVLNLSAKAQSSNSEIKNSPYNERKGIFKIFDKFKSTKCNVKKLDNTSIKLPLNEKREKTFSRTTIVRSTRKKIPRPVNIKSNNNIEPIMARLQQASDKSCSILLKDFISASGILDGLNNDYLLTNISSEKNLEDSLKSESVKNQNSYISKKSKNRANVFYNSKDFKGRQVSLRRKVLVNQANETTKRSHILFPEMSKCSIDKFSVTRSVESLNQSLDLHITDILEQLTKLSDSMSLMKIDNCEDDDCVVLNVHELSTTISKIENVIEPFKNILTLKINETNRISPKKIWNIKVSQEHENYNPVSNVRALTEKENVQLPIESEKLMFLSTPDKVRSNYVDCEIDLSFGSNIPTPERLNDLHQLELKLANLKEFWKK